MDVQAFYNGNLRTDFSYVSDPKRRFAVACMRVHDNLKAGSVGYVRDEKGIVYEISRAYRRAKIASTPETRALFKD